MRFSGKLSPVTTHLEDQIRIEPLQTPEQGEMAAGEAAAAPSQVSGCESGGREIGGREIGGREIGGREGPEPTRFGDWELRGRCIDF
jgi:hypothetical protein